MSVYAQPNGKSTEIMGRHGDYLKVRVKGQPIDGKANSELIDFFSKKFNVPKKSIIILKGEKSREKFIQIIGVSHDVVKDLS